MWPHLDPQHLLLILLFLHTFFTLPSRCTSRLRIPITFHLPGPLWCCSSRAIFPRTLELWSCVTGARATRHFPRHYPVHACPCPLMPSPGPHTRLPLSLTPSPGPHTRLPLPLTPICPCPYLPPLNQTSYTPLSPSVYPSPLLIRLTSLSFHSLSHCLSVCPFFVFTLYIPSRILYPPPFTLCTTSKTLTKIPQIAKLTREIHNNTRVYGKSERGLLSVLGFCSYLHRLWSSSSPDLLPSTRGDQVEETEQQEINTVQGAGVGRRKDEWWWW
ncbi:hypothetical protein Pmani_022671 [Petrolisthes manimaculis]|uniref:Uncharacterized protein n=1 Tax=Petrolisthes manimaculis TaxID=1843537 RepID=A0AAE1U464_9EUCA|nr:hypothetical protein Pmani_022671 [Petrolisthes manimaculis]